MPTDAENIQAIRAAVCGAATGYPDTYLDALGRACDSLRAMCTTHGLTVPPSDSSGSSGPYWAPVNALDDARQQLTSRWPRAGGNHNVRELVKYVEKLAAYVAAHVPVPEPEPEPETSAILLHHGWDITDPASLASMWPRLRADLPFDGYVVYAEHTSHTVFTGTALNTATARAELEPLRGLSAHNMVIVYVHPVTDPAAWPTIAENFGTLAEICDDLGIGIFFDPEPYHGDVYTSEDEPVWLARGRAIGDALRAAAPTVPLISTDGLWYGDDRTDDNLGGALYNDVAYLPEPRREAAMLAGIALNAAPGQYHDGGMQYSLRTAAHFTAARAWNGHGVGQGSAILPDVDEPHWNPTVGFGVYDEEYHGEPMPGPAVWGETVKQALIHTERYVWCYNQVHDWIGSGWPENAPVPQPWVDATIAARAAAAQVRPVG